MAHQLHCALIVLTAGFNFPLLCWGLSTIQVGGLSNGNQNTFGVNSNHITENGMCFDQIEVRGNGFTDTFKRPCSFAPKSMLNSDTGSIYGGSSSDFTLYSYEPQSLVVIDNGKCTKKVYTTTGEKTTSQELPVSDKECDAIKQKIVEEEEKNRKYWEVWNQNFLQQMNAAFPPCFPFCSESYSGTTTGNNKPGKNKSGKKLWKKK